MSNRFYLPESDKLSYAREIVLRNCEIICPPKGYQSGSKQYEWVTQGRSKGSYSSCGDNPHTNMALLGVRDTKILNRNLYDDKGNLIIKYATGLNINKLVFGTGTMFVWSNSYYREHGEILLADPGDILFISNPALDAVKNYLTQHVMVCKKHTPDSLTSYDYGQANHSCKQVTREIRRKPNSHEQRLGALQDRIVQGILRLSSLVPFMVDNPVCLDDSYKPAGLTLDENPYYETNPAYDFLCLLSK